MALATKHFTCTLNIKADVPTITGHVYPRATLEVALPLFVGRPIHHGTKETVDTVVGFVLSASLDESGEVMIKGTIRENLYDGLVNKDGQLGLSIRCHGEVDKGNKVNKIQSVESLHALSRRLVAK